jgi:hypothetical protein
MRIPAFASVLILLAAASMSAHAQSVAPIGSARIVFVGHSLINNEMPEMVKALAESKGLGIRRAVQVYNGAPIIYDWDHCRQSTFVGEWPPSDFACDAIEAGTDQGPYDALIIAQANNPIISPTNPSSLGTTPDDFEKFLNLFLSRNPSGRAYYFAQWEALDSQWLNGQDWTSHIASEMDLHERMTDRIEQISRDTRGRNVSVSIIPTSLAIRDLIIAAESGQFAGITSRSQLFQDNVHMNRFGNYFVACVVFASVYQQSPAGATGRTVDRWNGEMTNIPTDMALRLQNFAWNVVAKYRGWSGTAVRPKAPSSLTVQ